MSSLRFDIILYNVTKHILYQYVISKMQYPPTFPTEKSETKWINFLPHHHRDIRPERYTADLVSHMSPCSALVGRVCLSNWLESVSFWKLRSGSSCTDTDTRHISESLQLHSSCLY